MQITNRPMFRTLFVGLLLVCSTTSVAAPATEALCPVCRVHDGETELERVMATAEHEGASYGFCSTGCRDKFVEAPAAYVPPVFPRPAPAFTVRDLEGADVDSQTLRGRTVLLDFWATWCPPCIKDLPKLSQLHERYTEDGLTVVSVSIDEGDDAAKKVARMVKKRKATHPVYLDSTEAPAWATYLVRAVPTQFLINAEGHVVAQWSGQIDLKVVEAEIVKHLEEGAKSP
ncbi:MAG: redoxin domain-containing protein [Acidobacteriota bacterium]